MTTALARRFKVDVSVDNTNWVPLYGISDLNPQVDPTLQDSGDYDTNGWGSSEKTMQSWSVVAKANRKTTAGAFDPGQELCRAAHDQFGDSGRLYVRWYDRNGGAEAYSGRAIVGWSRSKTSKEDLEENTITFTGDGIRSAITNPFVPTAAPVIASATPTAATAGTQVTITGSGFTGTVTTTGVKFGATNATGWTVLSDSVIVAIVPAGSAGAANITVTNATGASTAFPYTRGA